MNLYCKNKWLIFLLVFWGSTCFAYNQSAQDTAFTTQFARDTAFAFSLAQDTTFSFQTARKSASPLQSPKMERPSARHSPKTAALSSALLPGLGQVYNGQWYKVPVIYAGAGIMWYFIDMNLKERKIYDKEILARSKSDTSSFNPSLLRYQTSDIVRIRNYYQNNFELSIIIAGVLYVLNIVDAAVYAHLFSFDVSDNLSLKITPYAQPNFTLQNSMPLDGGIKLCFTLK